MMIMSVPLRCPELIFLSMHCKSYIRKSSSMHLYEGRKSNGMLVNLFIDQYISFRNMAHVSIFFSPSGAAQDAK